MTSDAVAERPALSVDGRARIPDSIVGNVSSCLESVPRVVFSPSGSLSYMNRLLDSKTLDSSSPCDNSRTSAPSLYIAVHSAYAPSSHDAPVCLDFSHTSSFSSLRKSHTSTRWGHLSNGITPRPGGGSRTCTYSKKSAKCLFASAYDAASPTSSANASCGSCPIMTILAFQ